MIRFPQQIKLSQRISDGSATTEVED